MVSKAQIFRCLRSLGIGGLLWLGTLHTLWAQCSQCKAAAATTGENGELIVGSSINTGVLYLLSLPLLLVFITGTAWYLVMRQKRLAQAAE